MSEVCTFSNTLSSYFLVTIDKNHAMFNLGCNSSSCSSCQYQQRRLNGECIEGRLFGKKNASIVVHWEFEGLTIFDYDFPIWALAFASVVAVAVLVALIILCVYCVRRRHAVKVIAKRTGVSGTDDKPLLDGDLPSIDDDSSAEPHTARSSVNLNINASEEDEIEPPSEDEVEESYGIMEELAIIEAMIRNKKLVEALERYSQVLDKYGYQHGEHGIKEVAIHLADGFFEDHDRQHADQLGKLLLVHDKNSILGRSYVQKAKIRDGLVSNLTLKSEVRDRKLAEEYAFNKQDDTKDEGKS
jgi:hypothetical protein